MGGGVVSGLKVGQVKTRGWGVQLLPQVVPDTQG